MEPWTLRGSDCGSLPSRTHSKHPHSGPDGAIKFEDRLKRAWLGVRQTSTVRSRYYGFRSPGGLIANQWLWPYLD